jgi:hypothetical protein
MKLKRVLILSKKRKKTDIETGQITVAVVNNSLKAAARDRGAEINIYPIIYYFTFMQFEISF